MQIMNEFSLCVGPNEIIMGSHYSLCNCAVKLSHTISLFLPKACEPRIRTHGAAAAAAAATATTLPGCLVLVHGSQCVSNGLGAQSF